MARITALPQWSHLRPLLGFRQRVKDLTGLSESRVLRPDGTLGRLSLKTRKRLLSELLSLQAEMNMTLISPEEVTLIQKLWQDPRYRRY